MITLLLIPLIIIYLKSNPKMDLVQELKVLKQNLTDSSATTYASTLRSMRKILNLTGKIDAKFIRKYWKPIIEYIQTKSPKQRKVIASAVLILTNDERRVTTLKNIIADSSKEDNDIEVKQELTSFQKEGWANWKDILQKREELEETVRPLWTKLSLTKKEFRQIEDLVLLSLYTHNAPRRLMDYCFMSNGEPESDQVNGIDLKADPCFIFNVYKTSKTYGPQTIPIHPELYALLREYMKLNTAEWLVTNNKNQQMTPQQMTKRLSRIMNKKNFGVNILRHSYVSDVVLKGMPYLEDLKQTASELGHSMSETLLYKKHN